MRRLVFSLFVLAVGVSFADDIHYWQGMDGDTGQMFITYSFSADPSSVSSVYGSVDYYEETDDGDFIYYSSSGGDFSEVYKNGYDYLLEVGQQHGWGTYKPSSPEYADFPSPSSLPSSGGGGNGSVLPTDGGGDSSFDGGAMLSGFSDVLHGILSGVLLLVGGVALMFLAFIAWRKFKFATSRF